MKKFSSQPNMWIKTLGARQKTRRHRVTGNNNFFFRPCYRLREEHINSGCTQFPITSLVGLTTGKHYRAAAMSKFACNGVWFSENSHRKKYLLVFILWWTSRWSWLFVSITMVTFLLRDFDYNWNVFSDMWPSLKYNVVGQHCQKFDTRKINEMKFVCFIDNQYTI